jgi:hypothetical protein
MNVLGRKEGSGSGSDSRVVVQDSKSKALSVCYLAVSDVPSLIISIIRTLLNESVGLNDTDHE